MEPELLVNINKELLSLSKKVGMDPLLVQGAGGNSSIKEEGILWIKASGKWLAHAEHEDIFVPLNLEGLLARIRADELDPTSPEVMDLGSPDLRPSIETSLHAILPQKFVLHVHCVRTLLWAIRTDARTQLAHRLDGLSWSYVDYKRPGLPLTRSVLETMNSDAKLVNILVLANHGLVVAGDSIFEVEKLLETVRNRLDIAPRPMETCDFAALRVAAEGTGYRLPRYKESHAISLDPVGMPIATAGSLYPDHVVFLDSGVRLLDDLKMLSEFSRLEKSRKVVAIRDKGVLVQQDLCKGGEAMLQCLGNIGLRLPSDTEARYLTYEEERELMNWDAEKYRTSLAF